MSGPPPGSGTPGRPRPTAHLLTVPLLAAAAALVGVLPTGLPAQEPDAGAPAAEAAEAAAEDGAADSAAALEAFRSNIGAIHRRDRAAYLSHYLRSPRLARVGPGGVERGFEDFAAGAGETWPDTLAASHFRVTPVAEGVAHGAYHYRVVDEGGSQRGVSERVLVRTPEGWKVAVTTAFPSPPRTPPPPYALVGATVLDGTGGEPVPDGVVVMREGRIACVGARDECPLPEDAELVDASGRWIVPGLVDAHVHYSQTGWVDGRPDAFDLRSDFPYEEVVAGLRDDPDRFFRAYLCSGVTATFDVGGYPWTWDLREREATDPLVPRLAVAGPLLSTRDHWLNLPGERQFIHTADEEATRAGARHLVSHGTDAVKVWYLAGAEAADSAHDRAMLGVAAAEAEEAGLPLIVHATGLRQAKDAVRLGADLLVHSVYEDEVDEEFLRLAREAGTLYTPTVVVLEGYRQIAARHFIEEGWDLECVDPEALRRARLTDSIPGRPDPEQVARSARIAADRRALVLRNLERVHGAGIPVVVGTDAGNPLTLHGPAIHLELEAMAEAGLSPMELLVAATRNGARAMGREEEFGTLEEGKLADLVVLDADPLESVSNLRRVRLVVRGGEILTRDELRFEP